MFFQIAFLVHFNDCAHLSNVQLSQILRAIPTAIREANTFNCPDCEHEPNSPWPEVCVSRPETNYTSDSEEEDDDEEEDSQEEKEKINNNTNFEEEIIINKEEEKEEENQKLKEEEEKIFCFHTKLGYKEAILGLGICKKIAGNNYIKSLESCFDMISFEAFKQGVRHDASNNKFSHWIPLYINAEHGKRALPILKQAMGFLMTDSMNNLNTFEPNWILIIFPKLLSSMTVSLMSEEVHTSLRALEIYCYFHRLFLLFAHKYDKLRIFADNKIKKFIESGKFRNKKAIESLGEFLPLLTISSYTWDDVALAYIDESLDRSVKWYVQRFPELRNLKQYSHSQIISKVFEGSKVGCLYFIPFF